MRRARKAAQAFDCAELAINRPGEAWANLGDWSQAHEYGDAAAALARRLGEAAGLQSSNTLLDIGFGMGEQLGYWQHQFGVRQITGLNPSAAQFRHAAERWKSPAFTLHQAGAEELPRLSLGSRFDAAVALDCAYHFPQRPQVYRNIARALKPGCRFVLTDLLRGPGRLPCSAMGLQLLARASGIPPRNLMHEHHYRSVLTKVGFAHVQITDISDDVMLGFARWWSGFRRTPTAASLPPALRRKLAVTAHGLKISQQRRLLRYALIVATTGPTSPGPVRIG